MPLRFSAVKSGKEIPVLEPDDDDSVPLTAYRENETLQILQSPKQLVVVGSCSGTGKTTMFLRLHKEGIADLAYGTKVHATEKKPLLCIDEALAPMEANADVVHEKIETLRRQYEKIILVSGGTRFTPEEQAEAIIEKYFPNVPRQEIEIIIRTLKLMSRRQTMELIGRIAADPYGHIRTIWKPIPSELNVESMTEVILPELRLPRMVESMTVDMLNRTRTSEFRITLYSLLEGCYHLENQSDPVMEKQIQRYSSFVES